MKSKTYDIYSDGGHGWLKVKRIELCELGITTEISHCSFQRGEFVYLEEDGDMAAFVNAQEKRGVKVIYREHFSNKSSKIRNYESYIR